jgi:hypothetical protein
MPDVVNPVSPLVAAQLSQASYTSLAQFLSANQASPGSLPTGVTLPAGWTVDYANSGTDAAGNNQFITFVNESSQQVMVTFKGSNNLENWQTDLQNSGGSAFDALSPIVNTIMPQILSQYSDYQIMTDGHSLGGGLAQSFALQYGLSGYHQHQPELHSHAQPKPERQHHH